MMQNGCYIRDQQLQKPLHALFQRDLRYESNLEKIDKINKVNIIMRNEYDIRDQHIQLPLPASFQGNP